MASEIAIADAGCLTPAQIEMVELVLSIQDEREVPDIQAVAAFATKPCPVLPPPAQDEFRAIIKAMTGVLRERRSTYEQGKFQLAVYWAALRDVELFRLRRAADHFVKTAEWMPTPGQIRTRALEFSHPVYSAHARARYLVRQREHRLDQELRAALRNRTLDQAALDSLAGPDREMAVRERLVCPTPEGGIVYPTPEAWQRWLEHNRKQLTGE